LVAQAETSTMSDASVALERTDESGLAYVEGLLSRNGLPSEDVRSKPACFYVGYDGDEPVGVGGLERYGPDGLLRSVVVGKSMRGNGYGTALCAALEDEARDAAVETLYLLTTTAAPFFSDRGYSPAERATVPATVRGTTEFADLCPTTATCMWKSL